MTPLARLTIIVVHYRTPELLADCLDSIETTTEADDRPRVIVVENASPDGSGDTVEAMLEDGERADWVELVRLDDNRGFGAGNNAGIAVAQGRDPRPEYVFLLNPDTVVLDGALRALVDGLDAHPEHAFAGPRLEDRDGTAQTSAFRFPTIAGEFEAAAKFGPVTRALRDRVIAPPPAERPANPDWLSGAALLIRRSALDAVGLFDEGYFLYHEETDLFRRGAATGATGFYLPAARIIHLEGQATGVEYQRPARRPRYWFDSRRRYYLRHHGRLYAMAADAASLAGSLLYQVKRILQGRRSGQPPRFELDLLTQGAICRGIRGRRR